MILPTYDLHWITSSDGQTINTTINTYHSDLNVAYRHIDNIHRAYPKSEVIVIEAQDDKHKHQLKALENT